MKILNGKELAGFVKERQANVVREMRSRGIVPKLVIIRDSDNPVIVKYVNLKKQYGEDIGVEVEDKFVTGTENLKSAVQNANADKKVSGIIVQLPLENPGSTDGVVNLIAPEKDVDGLSQIVDNKNRKFESATATAINWLLAGHNIEFKNKRVALVGYGRLVGKPLKRILENSGVETTVFRHDSNLQDLRDFDVIITATGVPHLIKTDMVKLGATIIDAGTASENGVLLGDVDEAVRERQDLAAITPKIGGVGPLTVSVLFEDVIIAADC